MLSTNPSTAASPLLLLLLAVCSHAISLDCSNVRDGGVSFNLKSLGGPHSVYRIEDHTDTYKNTTFTIDICRPLVREKGIPKKESCPNGARVCGIERTTNPTEDVTMISDTWSIAGEFSHSIGGALDPKALRLKGSDSTSDREKEGVRVTLNGGTHEKQKQKAIVEFLCQRDGKPEEVRSNADDEEEDDDDGDDGKGVEHGNSGETQDDGHGGTLKLVSWEDEEEDTKVLRLQWDTKYACEDSDGKEDDGSSSAHWGFFTWLIVILFMGIAAYLIFGSWLNYNRYSARGWDVLPHSDFLHDLPYLFRDWMRRVINTIQGGGSRGGYSAV